jgi:hypothetical protein
VRWNEVAGPTFGSDPETEPVFEIVEAPLPEATPQVVTFTR